METRSIRGAISLISLCLISALGVVVGSYFALVTHAQQLGTRQFQNGRTAELAQAGLEEALWALNQNTWTGSGPAGSTAWTTSGANRTVLLDYGSLGHGASGKIALTVANYASAGPVWPTINVDAIVTLTDGRTIHKKLQATTTPAPLFGNAIASATAAVSFGGGGTVDSWNSDPDNDPATASVPYSFTAGNPANYAAVVAGCDDGTHGVVLNITSTSVNPRRDWSRAFMFAGGKDGARSSRSRFQPGANDCGPRCSSSSRCRRLSRRSRCSPWRRSVAGAWP
jgi:hypothetical protein